MRWVFRWDHRKVLSAGEEARRLHSAWLTRAFELGVDRPRIPVRRVDEGGFDPLLSRPGGKQRCESWWKAALDRVKL
ncbi:MAG: hypothetical protein SFY96_13695 [Planctomycetota bacterium]|nr:hypothetical protein [Planctomycetota bacterium]